MEAGEEEWPGAGKQAGALILRDREHFYCTKLYALSPSVPHALMYVK